MKKKELLGKLFLLLGGVATIETIGWIFDWGIYPFITYYFKEHLLMSFIILMASALTLNYCLVFLYDFLKKDIFGFEKFKSLKELLISNEKKNRVEKILFFLYRYGGEVPVLLFLTWYDPFLVVLYTRKGPAFQGFKKRDHLILIISTILSCIIWSAFWYSIVSSLL
ncbi:MAG TPA: hypothetical protein VGE18_01630 [Candidatus Paceibacterota bacterium]